MTASHLALRHVLIALLGTLFIVPACGKGNRGGGSESIWLRPCTRAYECQNGLSCFCGVCTVECAAVSDCIAFGDVAACVPGSKLRSSCSPTLCLRQEAPEGSGGSSGSGGAGAGGRGAAGTTVSGGASAGGAAGRTSIADASADGDSSVPDSSVPDSSVPDSSVPDSSTSDSSVPDGDAS